jgi:tripartite-type tricarboxylate transporter receptor subunit TctC
LLDLVKDAEGKELASFAEISPRTGWGAFLPPAIDPVVLSTLKAAFRRTVESDEFRADVQKIIQADVDPLWGDEMHKYVEEVMKMSPATIKRIREIYGIQE